MTIVAFLPGFTRTSLALKAWVDLLPAEVRLYDLPGHHDEPAIADPTMANLAARYIGRIPQDALVVGESLGSLVALEMASHGYRVAAFDPPLRPTEVWTLREFLPKVVQSYARIPWMPAFVRQVFGIGADGGIEPRDYWPLIEKARRPVDVIAAGIPLTPFSGRISDENTPTVLTADDLERLRGHPNVRLRVIDGPHLLLKTRVEASRQALLDILSTM